MSLELIGLGASYGAARSLPALERILYNGEEHTQRVGDHARAAAREAWADRDRDHSQLGIISDGSIDLDRIQEGLPRSSFEVKSDPDKRRDIFSALRTAQNWLQDHPSDVILIILGDEHGAGAALLGSSPLPPNQTSYARVESIETGVNPERMGKKALDREGISPSLVGFVEINQGFGREGRSTLADVSGLFPLVDGERSTALSSITPTIQDPTGMSSLIKSALALHRRILYRSSVRMEDPPSSLRNSGFYLPPESRPWLDHHQTWGRLAVMWGARVGEDGIGQVLLRESQRRKPLPQVRTDLAKEPTLLIPFGGRGQGAVLDHLSSLERQLEGQKPLQAIARSGYAQLNQGGLPAYVGALVGPGREKLRQEAERAQHDLPQAFAEGHAWTTPRGSYFTPQPLGEGGVAFVYPGAFNSYPGMGRELFNLYPTLHEGIEVLTTDISHSLAERFLYPRSLTPLTKEERAAHAKRFFEHPVELIESGISLSVLHTLLLKDIFQVQPQAAFGYSLGEISMLWANDIWQNAADSSAAWQRSALFKSLLFGPKEAVQSAWGLDLECDREDFWGSYILKAPLDRVQETVRHYPRAYLTIINAPGEGVIAGLDAECQQAIEELDCHALPMPFDAVIHNPAMRDTYQDFVDLYTNPVQPQSEINFYSAAGYHPLTLESKNLARQIADMTCKQVDFPRLVDTVYQDGPRIFVEVGPQKTCSRWIEKILHGQPHAVVPLNKKYQADDAGLIKVLSVLFSHRVPMDLSALLPLPEDRTRMGPQPPFHKGTPPAPPGRRSPIHSPSVGDYYGHLDRVSSRTSQSHQRFLKQQGTTLQEMTRLMGMKLDLIRGGNATFPPPVSPLFDEEDIKAFTLGDPRDCFGPSYEIYQGQRVPRLPNGPFRFIDRVLEIEGETGAVEPGSSLLSEVDIPHQAWFLPGASAHLPISILMEMALQPCGFLSAYLGSTFHKPGADFYFRNLDGEGKLLAWPSILGKKVRNRVELLSTSTLQNTIIQNYAFQLRYGEEPFYEGQTSFGYFTPQALSNQVGLDRGQVVPPWKAEHPERGSWIPLEDQPPATHGRGGARLPDLSNVWVSPQGGRYGKGAIYTTYPIDPQAWYFKAHFYQDPVMPGSLGVELMSRAVQSASQAGGIIPERVGRIKPQSNTRWKYRGQVTQRDKRVQLEVHIKEVHRENGKISTLTEGSLWNDALRIYHVDDLTLETVERVTQETT